MIDSAAIAKAREALSLVETYLPYGRHSVKMLSDFINEVEAAMKAEPIGYEVEVTDYWAKCLKCELKDFEANGQRTRAVYANPLAAQQRPHNTLLLQALGALESLFTNEYDPLRPIKITDAIMALRTALKEPS